MPPKKQPIPKKKSIPGKVLSRQQTGHRINKLGETLRLTRIAEEVLPQAREKLKDQQVAVFYGRDSRDLTNRMRIARDENAAFINELSSWVSNKDPNKLSLWKPEWSKRIKRSYGENKFLGRPGIFFWDNEIQPGGRFGPPPSGGGAGGGIAV